MTDLAEYISNIQTKTTQEEKDQALILEYIRLFPDLLTRNNKIAHFSSSAFIINKEHTKTLFIYHKIYDSWCWTGGHVDGEQDFIKVALKEAHEETGLTDLTLFSEEVAALDILPVFGHFKNGEWVSGHQHLSVAYVLEADENEPLIVNQDETKGLEWIPFSEIAQVSREPEMIPIYEKILSFINIKTKKATD